MYNRYETIFKDTDNQNFQSVSSKNIPRINLFLHVIETSIITVGDDSLALSFELYYIIHYFTAEECAIILKRRFVDDYLGSLCLNALHYALNGRLAEVVRV